MTSEITQSTLSKRRKSTNLARVLANYAGLLGTLIVSFLLVRILLKFGEEAFGIISLLGSGTGLGAIVQETVRAGTVPVLGNAFHDRDVERFKHTLSSAMFVSLLAAMVTVLIYAVLLLCIPLFQIPEELHGAARCFVILMGLSSCFTVAASPLVNMLAVSERMTAFNVTNLLMRLSDLLAGAITMYAFNSLTAADSIVTYGILFTVLGSAVLFATSAYTIRTEPRIEMRLSLVRLQEAKLFTRSAGWNAGVNFAMSLYSKADTVIYNLFFGLFGSMVFGIANQLTFYVRRAASGIVNGIDAVSARVANSGSANDMLKLLERSTFHQALVILPLSALQIIFTREIVDFWVADRLESPAQSAPVICALIQLLTVGVCARSLSDSWLKIMSGNDKVRSYAPWIFLGGICNPIIAIVGIRFSSEAASFYVAPVVFSALLVIVHLGIIPWVVRSTYSVNIKVIYLPFVRPLLATMAASVVAVSTKAVLEDGRLLLIAPLLFCATYSLLCAVYVLPAEDRSRLLGVLGLKPLARKLLR